MVPWVYRRGQFLFLFLLNTVHTTLQYTAHVIRTTTIQNWNRYKVNTKNDDDNDNDDDDDCGGGGSGGIGDLKLIYPFTW